MLGLVKNFMHYKYVNILFINFIILLMGLVIIEIIFGTWFYASSNFNNLLIPRNQKSILDNLPYESNHIGIYSRDKNGFRANDYSLNEIDILILGGSTTEEREIDDQLIWTKVFENKIIKKHKVLNAGIGGQTSYGHKELYRLWFSRFKKLKPNYMLVYLGINDALFLVESINSNDNFTQGRILKGSNRDLITNVNFIDNLIQYVKNNSVTHSLYLIIKGNLISRKYRMNYNNEPKRFSVHYIDSPVKDININLYDFNNYYAYYEKNILDIIKINKIYDSKLILSTQKISSDHWLNPYLKVINSFTLKVCKENNIICINLHENITFDDKVDLYDGIHTSPSGSEKVGETIAELFNKLIAR